MSAAFTELPFVVRTQRPLSRCPSTALIRGRPLADTVLSASSRMPSRRATSAAAATVWSGRMIDRRCSLAPACERSSSACSSCRSADSSYTDQDPFCSGQQRVQLAAGPEDGKIVVTADVCAKVGVQLDRLPEAAEGAVAALRPGLSAGQVVVRHPASRIWRVQVAGHGDSLRLARCRPGGLAVTDVVAADVPHRVPEAADDGLQPQLPAAEPRV